MYFLREVSYQLVNNDGMHNFCLPLLSSCICLIMYMYGIVIKGFSTYFFSVVASDSIFCAAHCLSASVIIIFMYYHIYVLN